MIGSKKSAKRFIAIYFLILYGAVVLRVDYFPFSWVPMYGNHKVGEKLTVGIGDKGRREQGFRAKRASGETLYISRYDLGVPGANFRRLYQQRAFNQGPPQDAREREALIGFNRWWYETFVGPDPMLNPRYPMDLLSSVNRTFGYGPSDPRRIVQLEADLDMATFQYPDVLVGNLSRPSVQHATAIITERGAFLKTGNVLTPMVKRRAHDTLE